MAKLSYEEYEKVSAKAESAPRSERPAIRFFSLKDDGETAIVRFNIHTLADIEISSVHNIENNENGNKRYRIVSCLRSSFSEPVEKCPLCAAGEKMSYKIFVPLIAYNQNDDGNIVADAMIWQQGTRIRQTLKSFIDDYGDLSDMLFKVTRHGKKGDVNTTYSILPANPNVYKSTIYVKDFSEFEKNPNYLDNFVHERSIEDMCTWVETGSFPNPYVNKQPAIADVAQSNGVEVTPQFLSSEEPIRGNVTPGFAGASPVRTFNGEAQNTNQTKPVRRYTY